MSTRTLVVDDDPFSQNLLIAILNGAGYEADVAPDGFGALRLAREKAYAIAFIDYRLPAMDGYVLAKLMRDAAWTGNSRPKLVLVTADRDGLATRSDIETLFDAMLFKPFDPRALIRLVEKTAGDGSQVGCDASRLCDVAAAFMADPSADRARQAATLFWHSRGLTGLPKVHVIPEPTTDEAADIGLCFDVVSWEKAELILLTGASGVEPLSQLRRRHGSIPPVASVDQSLAGRADVIFRVNDPNSWTELARCLKAPAQGQLEHDAEKWVPIFGKHHAPAIT